MGSFNALSHFMLTHTSSCQLHVYLSTYSLMCSSSKIDTALPVQEQLNHCVRQILRTHPSAHHPRSFTHTLPAVVLFDPEARRARLCELSRYDEQCHDAEGSLDTRS